MPETRENYKMTRRSPEEQLTDLEKRMDQLKAKKQQLQAKIDQKERKERTRRLIQVGAIFEKHFPKLADLSLEEVSAVAAGLHVLVNEHKAKEEQNPSTSNG
jgi:multidrug resistance efflux pump